MAVKIVTDSTADLPAQLIEELGITVVPLYVRFGEEVFRERVEISEDGFWEKLVESSVHPSTIQPSPQDFIDVYQKVCPGADGVVSVHISSKLSGTCNSALQGREMVKDQCPIEVVDSELVTMGLGLVVIAAAEAAKAGAPLDKVVAKAREAASHVRLLGLLDTLKYLLLGGRIGKAKALLGSILKVKPMITLKDGEVVPAGNVRTRSKGVQRLFELVKETASIQDLSILYNTTPDEAESLAERVKDFFPRERIKLARMGTTLGTHCGPGFLAVALVEG